MQFGQNHWHVTIKLRDGSTRKDTYVQESTAVPLQAKQVIRTVGNREVVIEEVTNPTGSEPGTIVALPATW
jgi:mannose-6-phosphate isomerase-like protein (cupin superfamily)